jgi:hypothetical protein
MIYSDLPKRAMDPLWKREHGVERVLQEMTRLSQPKMEQWVHQSQRFAGIVEVATICQNVKCKGTNIKSKQNTINSSQTKVKVAVAEEVVADVEDEAAVVVVEGVIGSQPNGGVHIQVKIIIA